MIKLKPTGTFHKQWVKCGRLNCKCAKGEPHGPYWYYFFRTYFAAWNEQKRRRICKNKLFKVYITEKLLKEAIEQEKEARACPKLTLSMIHHLKTYHIKYLSKHLEKACQNQNIEKAIWAEEELKKHFASLYAIFNAAEEANPAEVGKLDLAQIELGKLVFLTASALWTKQAIGKFEYGAPRR